MKRVIHSFLCIRLNILITITFILFTCCFLVAQHPVPDTISYSFVKSFIGHRHTHNILEAPLTLSHSILILRVTLSPDTIKTKKPKKEKRGPKISDFCFY